MTGPLPVVIALGSVGPALVTGVLDGHCRFVPDPGDAGLSAAAGAIVRADARVDQALLDKAPALRVKPGAVLVNCGRGALIDTDAIWRALTSGQLSGVGLDVFDPEPASPHPLYDHPDVVLTPHVMGLSQRATAATFTAAARGVLDVLAGREPQAVADPAWLARRQPSVPPGARRAKEIHP
jgi:D-isomer specific 2-hydroxyacid dehydrogenase, NAD binding domain